MDMMEIPFPRGTHQRTTILQVINTMLLPPFIVCVAVTPNLSFKAEVISSNERKQHGAFFVHLYHL